MGDDSKGVTVTVQSSPWTDENVTKLKQLWSDGFSASRCAAEIGLGLTRNAIIGKVHRLGLEPRKSANSTRPRAPRKQSRASLPPTKPKKVAPSPSARHIGLMELDANSCHYPFGEASPYTFCGMPVRPGSSYCPDCHDVVHGPDRDEVVAAKVAAIVVEQPPEPTPINENEQTQGQDRVA